MIDKYNTYGSLDFGSNSDSKPFLGDPRKLRRAVREELIYRYKYDDEDIEYLAIEYRLTPSCLREWLEQEEITPVNLNDIANLRLLEQEIEQKKRVNAVRIAGAILNNTVSTWERLQDTGQLLLEMVQNTVKTLNNQDLVDPRVISSLTRAHHDMVEQQVKLKTLAENQNSLVTMSGMVTQRIEDLFKEIDSLSVIGD